MGATIDTSEAGFKGSPASKERNSALPSEICAGFNIALSVILLTPQTHAHVQLCPPPHGVGVILRLRAAPDKRQSALIGRTLKAHLLEKRGCL
jgi:hypothetical protein